MGAVRLAVFGLALAALAAPALAEAEAADSSSFLLYEGVLVTPAQGAVYLMQPGGGLAAVGIDGAERWSSEEAARPLAIVGDRLIAQADADGAFALVGLELDSGSLAGRADVALPKGVFARIDDDLRGTFNASVSPLDGDLVVAWKSTERPAQAYLPSLEESMAPGSGNSAEVIRGAAAKSIRESKGLIALDSSTLAVRERVPTKAVVDAAGALPSLRELASGKAIRGIPNEGRRFLSVDGTHILVSERVSLGVAPTYNWTVYSRAGDLLGSIEANVSAAPFAVADGQLLFVSRSAVGAKSGSADVMLRGVDLASGVVQWKSAVRDTSFQGPFPP